MKGNAALDDVADSTDWLSTPLSGLAAVEATLRCQVCKDFYKTPMLTSCNHTFCSICIRRALSNDGKCPLCRAPEQELKLRTNWPMEEVVVAFTKARPDVLLFARSPQDGAAKRKRGETEELGSTSQPEGKRLRSSARLSKSRSMETTAEMARLEAGIPDQDPTDFEPDDGLVACPICSQRMKEAQVDRHIDTSCPGGQPQEPTSSRSTSIPTAFPPPSPRKEPPRNLERLPAMNYNVLKDGQLRKKLSELGIPTTGNRQIQEKRHKEWITIWNANCDSKYPRRKAELLHDLDVWERTLGTRAPTTSRALSLGAQIKDKDFDGAAWAAKHEISFKDLVASARRNKKSAEQNSSEEPDREQKTSIVGNQGNGEGEPTPQPDEEMMASLEHPEEPEEPQKPIRAPRIIDLTSDVASDASDAALSDGYGERRRVDIDASHGTTVMS